MGGCRCSYKTCKSATKTHQDLHFFHYPVKTRIRCMQWILNADRMEFSYLPNDQLRNKVICGLHFQESCFTNELRKRLVHDAVPTLDVGCDPEVDSTIEKLEGFSEVRIDYINMEQGGDGERSNDQTITTDDRVATIKATSGDGTTFSLDTLPYCLSQKSHLVTYNFVNGSLVPSVSFHETTSESNQNGSTVTGNELEQPYDDYTSIFGAGDPPVQYITVPPIIHRVTTPVRSINPDTNTTTTSADGQQLDSFVSDFIQDPLASEAEEQAHSREIECIIELDEHDMNATNTRDMHVISSGDHGFDTDTTDDVDNGVVMVSVEEIVPDNTQHQQHKREHQQRQLQKITAMIDISDDDDEDHDDGDDDNNDDDDDGDDCEDYGDDEAVIVSSKSLSDGNVEMEVLMPPLRTPNPVPLRTQPPPLTPPTLLHKSIVPAKVRRITLPPSTKNKVKIQPTEIIRPESAAPSTHIRNTAPQQQQQRQRLENLHLQQRSQLRQEQLQPRQQQPQRQQQRPQPQLERPQQSPLPPQALQGSFTKHSYTYVTTAQPCNPTVAQSVPVVNSIRHRTFSSSSSAILTVATSQRTTAIIKSAILPRPILRPEIQQIIPAISRLTQCAISPLCPAAASKSNTNCGNNKSARKRDLSAHLAALRAELPSSLYSSIAIHLQKKRSFFDTAETEFLTKLYTASPKGYTTLRSLGWELPEEDVVKELLEMKD